MKQQIPPLVMGCIWGGVLGIVGFGAGFFGPILLAESSPQGPLLGIFITGPLGVALGAIVGIVLGTIPAISDVFSIRLLGIALVGYAIGILGYIIMVS